MTYLRMDASLRDILFLDMYFKNRTLLSPFNSNFKFFNLHHFSWHRNLDIFCAPLVPSKSIQSLPALNFAFTSNLAHCQTKGWLICFTDEFVAPLARLQDAKTFFQRKSPRSYDDVCDENISLSYVAQFFLSFRSPVKKKKTRGYLFLW